MPGWMVGVVAICRLRSCSPHLRSRKHLRCPDSSSLLESDISPERSRPRLHDLPPQSPQRAEEGHHPQEYDAILVHLCPSPLGLGLDSVIKGTEVSIKNPSCQISTNYCQQWRGVSRIDGRAVVEKWTETPVSTLYDWRIGPVPPLLTVDVVHRQNG